MHKGCVHVTQRQPDPPFITEISLSKSSLAKHMSVSRNSVKAWHRLAYLMIRSYREQFPLLNPNNPVLGRNTEVFFTPYQCWVVGRVRWVMKCYRNYDVAKLYIKQNLHLFSQETFQVIINEFQGVA